VGAFDIVAESFFHVLGCIARCVVQISQDGVAAASKPSNLRNWSGGDESQL
jgi:hypothetical protein